MGTYRPVDERREGLSVSSGVHAQGDLVGDGSDAVTTHLCYPCADQRAHQELEPLEFRLDHDQWEVGLGVHVACQLFDFFDLWARREQSDEGSLYV